MEVEDRALVLEREGAHRRRRRIAPDPFGFEPCDLHRRRAELDPIAPEDGPVSSTCAEEHDHAEEDMPHALIPYGWPGPARTGSNREPPGPERNSRHGPKRPTSTSTPRRVSASRSRASSLSANGRTPSDLEEDPVRALDALLHADEELDGLATVDDPVIVGERDVHHGPHDDLVAHGDGALLDRVHAEDPALGRVEERSGEQGPVDPAVRDREGAAREVVRKELVLLRLLAELLDRLLELGEGERLGVADHRDDEPLPGADRDANVVVVPVDDLLALDLRVDRRERLERLDRRLHEEGHEAELHAVLLLELLLVLLAERHDAGEVALVEGREDRGLVAALDEALRDLLAKRRHGDALLGAAVLRRRGLHLRGRSHIRGEDGAAGARAGELGEVDPLLARHAPDRRRDVRLLDLRGRRRRVDPRRLDDRGARRRLRRGGHRGEDARRLGRGDERRPAHGLAREAHRRGLDPGQDLADRDLGARGLEDLLEDPAHGSRDLDVRLVALEGDDGLVALDEVALLLEPLLDARLAHRLAQGRHLEIDAHAKASEMIFSCSIACALAEPVAGLALSSRAMTRSGSFVRVARNVHAPMLSGSSWTQTSSFAPARKSNEGIG